MSNCCARAIRILVRSRAEFLAPDWEELAVEDEDEVSKLRHVCAFVLSEEGRRLCDKKRIDPAERALLDQRASAVLSFQPRFVVAALLPYEDGDADLPSMDDNGLADPYVVIRIQVHAHADHLSRAARRRAHQRGAGGRGARVVLVYAWYSTLVLDVASCRTRASLVRASH